MDELCFHVRCSEECSFGLKREGGILSAGWSFFRSSSVVSLCLSRRTCCWWQWTTVKYIMLSGLGQQQCFFLIECIIRKEGFREGTAGMLELLWSGIPFQRNLCWGIHCTSMYYHQDLNNDFLICFSVCNTMQRKKKKGKLKKEEGISQCKITTFTSQA